MDEYYSENIILLEECTFDNSCYNSRIFSCINAFLKLATFHLLLYALGTC